MASAPVYDPNGTVRTLKSPYIQSPPDNIPIATSLPAPTPIPVATIPVAPMAPISPQVVHDGVQTVRV